MIKQTDQNNFDIRRFHSWASALSCMKNYCLSSVYFLHVNLCTYYVDTIYKWILFTTKYAGNRASTLMKAMILRETSQ